MTGNEYEMQFCSNAARIRTEIRHCPVLHFQSTIAHTHRAANKERLRRRLLGADNAQYIASTSIFSSLLSGRELQFRACAATKQLQQQQQ